MGVELRVRNEPIHLWSSDFQKGADTIQMGKKQFFQQNGARMTGEPHAKEMKPFNSHYLVALNMRELGCPLHRVQNPHQTL